MIIQRDLFSDYFTPCFSLLSLDVALQSSEEAGVRARVASYCAAFNRRDWGAIRQHYSEDCVQDGPGQTPVHGRDSEIINFSLL